MARKKFMYARKKDRQPIIRIITSIFVITLLCICTLYGYERYSNPTLQGKWQSEETGEVVTFTKDGQVVLEGMNKPAIYEKIAPGKMRYTIDDKVFQMRYELEGRQLSWGVEGENLEIFMRK
ncbi:MAG: hypothetical protein ACRCW2_04980 [Cellulosilyticaceae bacterium]